jgi:hypothetical protein
LAVELVPVGHCRSTWLWRDGARHEPQYITYIVRTEILQDGSKGHCRSAALPIGLHFAVTREI